MTHPLTNELAEKVALDALWSSDIGEIVFTHNDMRAAWDLGESKGRANMLDDVMEWMDRAGYYFVVTDGKGAFLDNPETTRELLERLTEDLRPQKD